MPLTLKKAALLAKLSPEDLIVEINKGSLIALKVDQSYTIEECDLDAFLKKKSFDALWSENGSDEDELEDASRSTSMTGNLRRVLTAEAVSELKIQHQVLISRVQTLERLFSEFMDAEKDAESTLVLEDDWKISEGAGEVHASNLMHSDNEVQHIDEDDEQQLDASQTEKDTASESISLQNNHAVRKAYQLQTSEAIGNSKNKKHSYKRV